MARYTFLQVVSLFQENMQKWRVLQYYTQVKVLLLFGKHYLDKYSKQVDQLKCALGRLPLYTFDKEG